MSVAFQHEEQTLTPAQALAHLDEQLERGAEHDAYILNNLRAAEHTNNPRAVEAVRDSRERNNATLRRLRDDREGAGRSRSVPA